MIRKKRWMLTCLAGAMSQALPLFHGEGVAFAQIVTSTGEVSPVIPATGGTVSGQIIVGDTGVGSLSAADAAVITTDSDVIFGLQAGSEGSGSLTGAGTAITADGGLYVGSFGLGSLNLIDSATFTAGGAGFIGEQTGSQGGVSVTDAGSSLNITNELYVGGGGRGTLVLNQGGTATVGGLISVGDQAGSEGSIEVSGIGSALNGSGDLSVGQLGTGSLSIAGGGVGTINGSVFVGGDVGSIGTVNIAGIGSALNTDGNLSVGYSGTGTLQVSNEAALSAGGNIVTGELAGSQGSLSADGPGTTVTAGELYVGYAGTGSLSLTNGATVSSGLHIRIGTVAGGNGTVTLAGAGTNLTAADDIGVGAAGTGRLEMSDGATLTAGDIFGVAASAGSTGTVNISGPGTTITSANTMAVGVGGNGVLTASDGALITTSQALILGVSAASTGVTNLTGTGTRMTLGSAFVGSAGSGTLSMNDGATSTVASTVTIGNQGGSQGNVILSGAGTALSAGANVTVGDAGNGSLQVTDGATLASAADLIVGRSIDSQGAVLLSGAQSSLSASNIEIGQQGSGTVFVRDSATLRSTGALGLATAAGSEGTLVIGGNAGSAPAAAGEIDVASIDFGLGTGLLTLNHTSDNYRLTSAITGNGTIEQLAGSTSLAGDGSGFGGLTSVNGGTLYVEQSLGGTVNVGSGGTLGGAGTIGNLNVTSQGTVSPGYGTGASYETLTVNGNYRAQAGSVYLAQVNLAPAQSDLIAVRGTATVDPGSRLSVQFAPASASNQYALGTRYVLLSADQGVTGTYTVSDGELKLSAVLDLQPGYDPQSAYLEVVQNRTLTSLAQTGNQVATLTAVDSTPQGNQLRSSLSNLPTENAVRQVADNLSGEVHASSKIVALDHSRFLREATTSRMRQADPQGDTDLKLRRAGDEWVGWGQVLHSSGHLDGDSNATGLDDNYNGFLVGADRTIGDQWRVGVVAGAAHTNISSSLTDKSEGDDYTFGVYAGTLLGQWRLTGGAAYTYQDMSIKRETEILGSRGTSSSHPKAHLGQVYSEIGYPFALSNATIEPFAQVAYVRLWSKDFKEHGGAAPLEVKSSKEGTTLTTLGSHGSSDWLWNGKKMSAHGTLGWRHAEGYVESDSTMNFTDSTDFTVVGVSLPRNAAVVEAGLKLHARKDLAFDLSYNGLAGDGSRQNTVKASAIWEF